MSIISMIPEDGTVVIDGFSASDIDFTGIDPTIHSIQWYGDIGEVEYKYEFTPGGVKPLNATINNLSPYQSYVAEAEQIIYAYRNPIIVYSTSDSASFEGLTYDTGMPIVITTPNTPPPTQSTYLVPPTPEDFQKLYWDGNAWVLSAFPITLSLADAQENLTLQVQENAATNSNYQARIHSFLSLLNSSDAGLLPSADYALTLAQYEADQQAKVTAAVAQINAATQTSQLYSFDPHIEAEPA
jgi:hypothetical protein